MPSAGFLEITQIFAELDINILRIEQLDSGDVHALEFLIGTREAHSSEEVLNALVKVQGKIWSRYCCTGRNLFQT